MALTLLLILYCIDIIIWSPETFDLLIFSEVFMARCKKAKKIVALKKVLMENEKEGVSVPASNPSSFQIIF